MGADGGGADGPRHRLGPERLAAQRYATRARAAATEHNRAGNLRAAQRELAATAARIRQYAGEDPELHRIADELEREVRRHEQRFDASTLKFMHAHSYSMREGKDVMGRKRRG